MKQARLLILAMLSLPCAAEPVAHHIDCPSEVSRRTLQVAPAPDGWTAFVPFEYQPGLPLHSAGVMLGAPFTMLISKPSDIGRSAGLGFEKWAGMAREGYGEKWIACYYGENGQRDVILSKRLADTASECTVTYPKKKSSNAIDIVCKW